jgi:23S rRNA-/tRNA-specific pseudouridylate synthase
MPAMESGFHAPRVMRFRVPADRAGLPLAEFLAVRFALHSRDRWAAEIRAGCVRLNRQPADPEQAVAAGDTLEYRADDIEEPTVRTDVTALFEDRDVLVLNKPPNLPCHPGGIYLRHTLWAILRDEFHVATPVFVNRLDRETSGVMLVAKTAQAGRRCQAQIAAGRMEKRYLALVEGDFPEALQATGYLVADSYPAIRKRRLFVPAPPEEPSPADADDTATPQKWYAKFVASPHRPPPPANAKAEWAETAFRRLSRAGPVSEVEARPATGRIHQIRATLHALGFPVVGDKLYGPDPAIFVRFCDGTLSEADRQRLRLDRQALHATYLRFRHPTTGRSVEFAAPVPDDLSDLLLALRREQPVSSAP